MPLIGDKIKCPECGKPTLERQIWKSTLEKREECSECGYFYEETKGILLATQLGLIDPETGKITDEKTFRNALKEMHFDTSKFPYARRGFIRKDGSNDSEYLIATSWFSSPSHIHELEVNWDMPGGHV